jgi:hypothetical protein
MRKIPGNSLKVVLQRTFLDQIRFAPIFIPTFITSLMILESTSESKSTKTITETIVDISNVLARDVPGIVVTNWALWVPAMLVNFRYVPMQWQVLFSNCVGFVWNTYLSWKTQEDVDA